MNWMGTRRAPGAIAGALALGIALLAGCGEGPDEDRLALFTRENLAPTTEIVNPELSGEETTYNLLVSWRGYDEDGTIVGFQIAVDDTSAWDFTTAFDSLFVFESEACCVQDTTVEPGGRVTLDSLAFGVHTLFVRAVDNTGVEDRTPDHITFTSTNIFPETVILRGPSQGRPNDITAQTVVLEWEGRDEDGVVVAYRYKLDDKPWVSVDGDCTFVRFTNLTTAEFIGDTRGFHDFTVISIDNAGAVERTIDPQLNTRHWESVKEISGRLDINSNVMGSRFGVNTIEGQVFEGTRLSFNWRGDASIYGGIVQCYQYAYDQQEVFSSCDLSAIQFPPERPDFVPPIGSHTLFVRAFDDAGQTLRANFSFVVLRGPGSIDPVNRKVLYVDDYNEGNTGSGLLYPNDRPEDAFWDSVLVGYPRRNFDADLERDVPTARILGEASTVVWYLDFEGTQLATSNDPSRFRNPLGPYLNAGGNVILCGFTIMDNFTPDNNFDSIDVRQPGCIHDTRGTYAGGDRSLNFYPAFCDTGLHFVYDAFKVRRSFRELQSSHLRRLKSLKPPEFPDLPDLDLDVRKRGAMPLPGRFYFEVYGLEEVEHYELRQISPDDPDKVIPLWNYISVAGEDKGVAAFYVPKSQRTGRGHVIVLGFPPYFFETEKVKQVFHDFLDRFGENCSGPDCGP